MNNQTVPENKKRVEVYYSDQKEFYIDIHIDDTDDFSSGARKMFVMDKEFSKVADSVIVKKVLEAAPDKIVYDDEEKKEEGGTE